MPFTVREADLDRYAGDRDHWSEVYQGLIIPAVERAGLTCHRDDDDSTSRFITEGIWAKLENADVVVCDLSATNPNVFLELGWALRADQRFVLIKDELTQFQFDLNQYFTFTYSHTLRPKRLARDIDGLQHTLVETLADSQRKYSIVKRLGTELSAIKATEAGSVDTFLLHEMRDELRLLRSRMGYGATIQATQELKYSQLRIRAEDWDSLREQLVGTQWTNTLNGHALIFLDDAWCLRRGQGSTKWDRLRYECESFPKIIIRWSDLGPDCSDFPAVFANDFRSFLEAERIVWKPS
jgi:hypothetical protein